MIGDGSRVSFWKDFWCGEGASCIAYPTLFSLIVRKEALIREVWDILNEGGWTPCFSRPFNYWEVTEVDNFLQTIQPWRVVSNREDRLILKGSNSGIYSVKLMYEALNRPASESRPFPALSVWNLLVPLNVGFFAWEASWGKVLTLDQLKKGGRPLANRCYLCEKEEETLNFLFLCAARRLEYSGSLYWLSLVLGGCFLSQFDRFSLLGKELKWERNVRKCGGQLPFASFGQCGMKEIEWPLIMRSSLRIH